MKRQTTRHYVPTHSIAFAMGAEDAQANELCVPEMYFTHRDDLADYTAGYESVKGSTLLTSSFTQRQRVAA